ncbi:type I polyketide synthase [Nocardia asteroides]
MNEGDTEMSSRIAEDVACLLAELIAKRTGVGIDRIERAEPLSELGLDSMTTLDIIAELERKLGIQIPDTLPWEYPTIDLISAHIAGQMDAVADTSHRPASSEAGDQSPTPAPDGVRVAVVGIAARYPGAADYRELWEILATGADTITEIPRSRWDNEAIYAGRPQVPGKTATRHGGFLDGIEEFDHRYFKISAREAKMLDPQQRLVLQASCHALEDAGIAPNSLSGSRTGVYIGAYNADYATRIMRDTRNINPHFGGGNMLTAIPNRVSYQLNLNGPSLAVDTACSSSLTAIHQARLALEAGDIDLAIVGGVNLILEPTNNIYFSQAGVLAPDGRCKTFAREADGYVRSEGVGIVVLERTEDTLRRAGNTYAVIAGSAINHDGRSNGFTAPSPAAQVSVITDCLTDAELAPEQIDYLEAHGTGTPLGDRIELQALARVFAERQHPLYVGSIKSNIGHSETAAGVAGVIKICLSMQHRRLPASLYAGNPSDHLHERFEVPTSMIEWPVRGNTMRAGVSSFGLGGANAHIVLEREVPSAVRSEDELVRPVALVLSADAPDALPNVVGRAASDLRAAEDVYGCAVAINHSRSALPHRLAVTADSAAALADAVDALERRLDGGGAAGLPAPVVEQRKLAFVFSGHMLHYPGMGRALYDNHATFRRIFTEITDLARDRTQVDYFRRLHETTWDAATTANDWTQVATFAVQVATAMMWRDCGIEPTHVIGHSLGEYAAAAAAGLLSVEDALAMVIERSAAVEASPEAEMWCFFGTAGEVRDLLGELALDVAAVNSPDSVVVSGLSADLAELGKRTSAAGIDSVRLAANRAGHCRLLEPHLGEFARVASAANWRASDVTLISNLTGQNLSTDTSCGQYWTSHARQPVLFSRCLEEATSQGVRDFLEVGVDGTLGKLITRTAPNTQVYRSMSREDRRGYDIVETASNLFLRGFVPDWRRVLPTAEAARRAPGYPFRRDRHWFSDVDLTNQQSAVSGHPMFANS